MSVDTRASARAFVRSLNILLKFARLYEFGHARTGAQFDTTWRELKSALDESAGSGLLLGASGNQILLDGVPLGAAAGERSFAQLLTSSGIASIHFGTTTTQPQFARFVRGFPSGNAKPTALAEQLKATLAGDTSIKINEIRYVAEDSSVAGIKMAANLTAKVLGAQGDKFKDFFDDPNRLLQMILAAESSRGPGGGGSGPGTGGGGGVGGSGSGTLWDTGAGGSGGTGSGAGGGSGTGGGQGTAKAADFIAASLVQALAVARSWRRCGRWQRNRKCRERGRSRRRALGPLGPGARRRRPCAESGERRRRCCVTRRPQKL